MRAPRALLGALALLWVCPARAEPATERLGFLTLSASTGPEVMYAYGRDPSVRLGIGLWPVHGFGIELTGEIQPLAGDDNTGPLYRATLPIPAGRLAAVETIDPRGHVALDFVAAPASGLMGPPGGPRTGFQPLFGVGFAYQLETLEYVGLDGTVRGVAGERLQRGWASLHVQIGARLLLSRRVAVRVELHGFAGPDQAVAEDYERSRDETGPAGEFAPCGPDGLACRPILRSRLLPRFGLEVSLGKGPVGPAHPRSRPAKTDVRLKDRVDVGVLLSLQGTPSVTSWIGLGLRLSVLYRGVIGLDLLGLDVIERGAPGGVSAPVFNLRRMGATLPAMSAPRGMGEAALMVVPVRGLFPMLGGGQGELAAHVRIGSGVLGTADLDNGNPAACPESSVNVRGVSVIPDPDCAVLTQMHPMLVWGGGARLSLGGFALRFDLDGTLHREDHVDGGGIVSELRPAARGTLTIGFALRPSPRATERSRTALSRSRSTPVRASLQRP